MHDFVEIDSIEFLDETEDVFDIEVEDNHNFFANGMLAHNCIGGPLSYDIYEEFPTHAFDAKDVEDASNMDFLGPHLLDDPNVMERVLRKVGNTVDRIVDAVGMENFFLELQFNKLSAQHLTNRVLIEYSRRTGIPLIATADSHYCRPEVWRERAIYQKLGWLNYTEYGPESIPKSIDELKAELYPKNAQQMWDSYLKTGPGAGYGFYDDRLVCEAIERTHDIAFQMIGDVQPDTSVKLPSWSVPKGKTPDQALAEACDAGMKRLGLDGSRTPWNLDHTPEEYAARLGYELSVISGKKFSEYFLTMKAITDVASEHMLVGCGRGSAAGSLVNYVLGITQVDPLKFGLIFERFINRSRVEFPDIDCLASNTRVVTPNGYKQIDELSVGDIVVDVEGGQERVVLAVKNRQSTVDDIIITLFCRFDDGRYGALTCNHAHRLYVTDGIQSTVFVAKASDIRVGMRIVSSDHIENHCVVVGKAEKRSTDTQLTDITVEGSSSFRVIPFDVIELRGDFSDLLVCINVYDIDTDNAYDIAERLQEGQYIEDCSIIRV